jgi:hypothetical protein
MLTVVFTLFVLSVLVFTSNAHAEFGVAGFDGQMTADAGGSAFTQAGGHPYAISTEINFNTLAKTITLPFGSFDEPWPAEPVKDVLVDVPPGLVGNPTSIARCAMDEIAYESPLDGPLCSPASQIGIVTVSTPAPFSTTEANYPVFNMVPPPGVPARFAFNIAGVIVSLDAELRSGSDYGLSVNVRNISEGAAILGTKLTLWGVPTDSAHDTERSCPGEIPPQFGGPSCGTDAPRVAFLRMPTSCPADPTTSGLVTTARADSWLHPGVFDSASYTSHLPPSLPDAPFPGLPSDQWGAIQGTTGCGDVPFDPTFTAQPAVPASPGASGYVFDLTLPQFDNPNQIGESDLRSAVVTLPEGVRVNPAEADGLQGCSPAQVDLSGSSGVSCPDASKIGSLTIHTPLLDEPLEGAVYLASPHENPSKSLLAVYLVAEGQGVIVKLAGSITTDPLTGRLTATFEDQPQLPFSSLHVEFFGGSHAPLSNPPACGTYTTHAVLTGWSGKTVESDSSFTTSRDGRGEPCPPVSFHPAFTAGTTNPIAGGFSPFSLQLARSDTDSEFQSLSSLNLPSGLLADIKSIPTRCTTPQAASAACPAASHIGEVTVGAGTGPDPYYVNGDVYLTGPYQGDPFGLAIIVHALAGPFDLGYVVVRAGVRVNDDGSVTTKTDPFPTILEGIPLQVRDIRVSLDRPGFILNPTNCAPMSVAGTANSTDGQTASLSSRFQVGECSKLKFRPSFTVSTTGKTHRATGASLMVRVASGKGQANIRGVHVSLPKALPSRLSTLKQACPDSVFNSNPAGCPVGSLVGSARAVTPILAVPLEGPAYLVSHGNLKFPDLVLVLQGEGIVLHVTGHTDIKNGITTSTFDTVPDAPISSFVLKLPTGPHSALAAVPPASAKGSLCAAKLVMPTTITAQNGAVIKQSTRIAVTGCVKHKAKKVKHKARRGRGKARKK